MRIALATAAAYPELAQDDQVLHAELLRRGVEAVAVIWDGETDWARYDVIVARSIWDYHLKYPFFLKWLDALDASGARVHNPTPLLRRNADKRYLLELAQKDVRITPTRIVARAEGRTLSDVLEETGWRHAVVKPVVSASGHETWFIHAPCSLEAELRFANQTANMAVLVQQFAPGVQAGELSFVFITGEYTHTILKSPADGEFRVHIEHGGSVAAFEPATVQIDWACSVIDALGDQPWTYGRVDAVADGAGLMLMELELLDPELFFLYSAAATERFIQAITGA